MNRIFSFITGVCFLIVTLKIFVQKNVTGSLVQYDFSSLGDFYILAGLGAFAASISGFYLAFRPKSHIKKSKYTHISICPQCKTKYYNKDLNKWLCSKCNISVVDIDKYYKKINKQKSKTKLNLKPGNQTKPNPNKKIDMSKINIKDIKIDSLKRTNK